MTKKPIFVTQPLLPPLEEFIPYLQSIWNNKILTNNGPFHSRLEHALCEYLGVEHLALFANGTLALLTALQTLRIRDEVITTPYSFVATAHTLLWNNIKPVFVDIDPNTCNLDPAKIEDAITPKTTAILAVHCYGAPCAIEKIQQIADIYGLKVIYDAAHAFGVRDAGGSVLRHGDLSVLSFHATKVFNTFEGGAIICPDAKTKERIDFLKNFGFANEVTVMAPGINGKMNEVSAAFGLLQLQYIDEALRRRKEIEALYRQALAELPGISLLPSPANASTNSAYMPILIDKDAAQNRDAVYYAMKKAGIHGRRYFHPLISDMPMYRRLASAKRENLPVALDISRRVICLPIYPTLSDADVMRIVETLSTALKK